MSENYNVISQYQRPQGRWLTFALSGMYFTGDGAQRKNSYYQIIGRMDDVLNVTGHRLGTAEIEDILVGYIVFFIFFRKLIYVKYLCHLISVCLLNVVQ